MDKTKIAVIDFDGTLFNGESMPFIWKRYGELGYSKTRQMRALFKIIVVKFFAKRKIFKKVTTEVYKESATNYLLKMFKGFTKKDMEKFFNEIYDSIEEKFNEYVVKRIYDLKNDNYEVILISGSYNMLMELVAKKLDIDYSVGTQLNFLDNGNLDVKTRLNIIKKELKVEELYKVFPKEVIDYDKSYSFSDSIADLPILETTNKKEAINPDGKLRKIALDNNWIIYIT